MFEKDCLIYLGTCVSLTNSGKYGSSCLDYIITYLNGEKKEDSLVYGELKVLDLKEGEKAEVEITPTKHFDLGEGKGKKIVKEVTGGVVGLVIDARGRPLSPSKGKDVRAEQILKWNMAFGAYPD